MPPEEARTTKQGNATCDFAANMLPDISAFRDNISIQLQTANLCTNDTFHLGKSCYLAKTRAFSQANITVHSALG